MSRSTLLALALALCPGLAAAETSAFATLPPLPAEARLAEAPAPTAAPPLDPARLRRAVQRNARDFATCHRRQLKRGRAQAVDGRVRFTVRPDGYTAAPEVDVRPPALARCLEERIRLWTLPRFSGDPVVVELPVVFTTPKAEDTLPPR